MSKKHRIRVSLMETGSDTWFVRWDEVYGYPMLTMSEDEARSFTFDAATDVVDDLATAGYTDTCIL